MGINQITTEVVLKNHRVSSMMFSGIMPERMKESRKISETELHDILPFVEKPSRYIGGERGSVYKEFDKSTCRIAFAFPDVYEIGSGNLGQEILYHQINAHRKYLAERVFAPWDDFEKKLQECNVPLMTLESQTAVKEFDLLAFTLPYELGYSSVLTILNSSGLPLKASDRTFPLVAMGGECAFNPSVMSKFIDFFHIGDGEVVIEDIARIFAEHRDNIDRHPQDKALKNAILAQIADLPGIFVPSIGAKSKSRAICNNLDSAFFPKEPIIPYFGDMKSRVTLELFRGCTQGCRFCQAGYTYRPYRKRSLERLLEIAHASFAHTGHSEISLGSLNTTDYPHLEQLIEQIIAMRGTRPLRISIPSSRISSFDGEFATKLKPYSSGSLTLAIEAGTERLRKVINKHTSDDEINQTVRTSLSNGFGELKLYYMIGLPTETEDDILSIHDQVSDIRRIFHEMRKNNEIPKNTNFQLKVSVSNFVPKPHTPFQWCAMDSIETLSQKQSMLKPMRAMKSVKASFHSAKASFLEGVFSRGDARVGDVIERAWRMGSRFESWKERLDLDLWMKAFDDEGIDPNEYIAQKDPDSELPWDVAPSGIDKSFLRREYEKSLKGEETKDCFESDCAGCGLWNEICVNLPRGK